MQDGATPVAAEAGYDLGGPVTSHDEARALAAQVEAGTAGPYADLVGATDASERGTATAWLVEAAVRSVKWGGEPTRLPGSRRTLHLGELLTQLLGQPIREQSPRARRRARRRRSASRSAEPLDDGVGLALEGALLQLRDRAVRDEDRAHPDLLGAVDVVEGPVARRRRTPPGRRHRRRASRRGTPARAAWSTASSLE